ncbi:MAG: sodium:solute symporter [Bacteroidota bacterium]
MDANVALIIIVVYFAVLFVISLLTSKKADAQTFFSGNKTSPWYVVAFGMVGATLSGVTFISVPGAVGNSLWSYFQFVLGNLVGYGVIALVLMPLYYRLNLVSIYGYLKERFGPSSYKTGASFFILSRIIGASLRVYLVVLVLQLFIFDDFDVPFGVTVLISIALIYLYTFRGGIKTVVWTDTLQTFFILLAAGITVYVISSELNLSLGGLISTLQESSYTNTWVWDLNAGNNFWKQFFSGMAITIVMVGLDQDMMQKNLTIKTLGDAQKNMAWFSVAFVLANILFLSLGALLYIYGEQMGIVETAFHVEDCEKIMIKDITSGEMMCMKTDQLFPLLAKNYLGATAAVVFLLGVIAAAYSSADSALTALTTSFCVDILGFMEGEEEKNQVQTRNLVHVGFSIVLFMVILAFNLLNDDAVVWGIFKAAGYTYGPLLGLYAFGLYTKWQVKDRLVPLVTIICPLLSYAIHYYSPTLIGYTFGFEILILNGLLTFIGLWLIRNGKVE